MRTGDGGSGWDLVPAHMRARIRRALFAAKGHVCHLRIKGVCTYTATQADHIRDAKVHGHGLDNLQPACAPCNRRKGRPVASGDPAPLPGGWTI